VVIRQGDVYWIDLGQPRGRALAYRHPYVVVQGDPFNRSKIGTVIVCGLTSNLKRAGIPGNVLLKKGEANLPKDSVALATQLYTVDRNYLSDQIGALGSDRIEEILNGIKAVLDLE
jgi:mRNA interferase MazF